MFQNMVNKKWLQKVIEKTCKVTRVGWRRGKMGANCLKTVIERIFVKEHVNKLGNLLFFITPL
jgi:hypothetical protein